MSLLCSAFPSSDGICVNTGEVKISTKPLTTSFVNTCTAIGFKFRNNNFLAHIDVMNPNMENITSEALSKVDISEVKLVNVWKGSKCKNECPSYILALKFLKQFNKEIIHHKSVRDISIIKVT